MSNIIAIDKRGTNTGDKPLADGVTPEAKDGRVSVHELYTNGLPIKAIDDLAPNTALLMPIRRPGKSEKGIYTSVDEVKGTLGTACIAYIVVGVSAVVETNEDKPATWLPVEPGDVVVVRSAFLEPLHTDLEPLAIRRRHILAKIRLRDELVEA
jgi:hypothetical protein